MSWGKGSLGMNVHHVKTGGHPSTSIVLFIEVLFSVSKALGGFPNLCPTPER